MVRAYPVDAVFLKEVDLFRHLPQERDNPEHLGVLLRVDPGQKLVQALLLVFDLESNWSI